MKYISKIYALIISGIIIGLPYLINTCYLWEAPNEIWQSPSEWTKFWGQYLWGALSVIMIVIAWLTLKTTKEANRPYISVDFVSQSNGHAFIRCRNLGNSMASNVKINIAESFIKKLNLQVVKSALEEINKTEPFYLPSKEEKIWDIFLIPSYSLYYKYFLQNDKTAYDYKGTSLSETEWKENARLFESTLMECNVNYNKEYSDIFQLDYNNILDGTSIPAKISADLFSIMFVLSKINDTITSLVEKYNGAKQDK